LLLTKHLKEVHGLVAEKAKLGKPSIFERRLPRHQNHVKMNVRIFGNAMVVQRWNDRKVATHIRAKTRRKWNKLVIITKQCPPFPKPTLVKLTSDKLTSEQLLQMLGISAWGVGNVPRNATSRMEKDEDLQKMIRSTRFVYAQRLKMAWDAKN
jgi:hypothetical protein